MAKQAELILSRLREIFPVFPARVEESPEDSRTLLVFVFNVPQGSVDKIEDAILSLQDEVDPALEKLFLPMVKTRETTRKHYPGILAEFRFSRMLTGLDSCAKPSYTLEEAVGPALGVPVPERQFPFEQMPEEAKGPGRSWTPETPQAPAAPVRELSLAA